MEQHPLLEPNLPPPASPLHSPVGRQWWIGDDHHYVPANWGRQWPLSLALDQDDPNGRLYTKPGHKSIPEKPGEERIDRRCCGSGTGKRSDLPTIGFGAVKAARPQSLPSRQRRRGRHRQSCPAVTTQPLCSTEERGSRRQGPVPGSKTT